MTKTQPTILKYLKDQGHGIDLPLDVLRQFQEFEKTMNSTMNSYDHLPSAIAYGMRSFKKIEMLGMALTMSGDYPLARRCHEDLMQKFGKDRVFTDGATLLSWILFNLPISRDDNTIATEVLGQ